MYERIVVGTDGSAPALEAVRTAGKMAKLCGLDTVHVVAACRPLSPQELAWIRADLPPEFHDSISPHLGAEDNLAEAEAALRLLGITAEPHDMSDGAASSILTVAESVNADLIVVGARGMGPLGRFMRGSVSTKVTHHSPCDVLVVEHS